MTKKATKFTKTEIAVFFAMLLVVVGLFIIIPYLPDPMPREIRNVLTRQGHDVENIDFEFVRNVSSFGERIYESSEPIYFNGEYISKWVIRTTGFGSFTPFIPRYSVKPYVPQN